MQWFSNGVGLDFGAAMSMIGDDARVVDGNPCYPEPLPEEAAASLIFGQIVVAEPGY